MGRLEGDLIEKNTVVRRARPILESKLGVREPQPLDAHRRRLFLCGLDGLARAALLLAAVAAVCR
jgi:hypothetical protein